MKNRKMKPVTAAGGVVFKNDTPEKILLIYRNGIWDLPKGRLEPGEDIEFCARREVREEVGLSKLPRIETPLCETYHEYFREEFLYGKTTHWFAMKIEKSRYLTPQKEEGITALDWVDLQVARDKVGYKNLLKVLKCFKEWIKKRHD